MQSAVNPGKLYGAGSMRSTLKAGRIWAWVAGERRQARAWRRDSCELGQQGQSGKLCQARAHHCQSLRP